jgi:hypothetical protein
MAKLLSRNGILRALEKRGVAVDIKGCGCCGSPEIKIFLDSRIVYDTESDNLRSRSLMSKAEIKEEIRYRKWLKDEA